MTVAKTKPRSAVAPRAMPLELADYVPYLVNRVGTALATRFSEIELSRHGLSLAMWRVMAALSNAGEQRQIDLAGMTSTDVSTLSRLVTRLVCDGLVTRNPSATSNREVVVALSSKGQTLVRRLIPTALALEREATADLTASELEIVKRALTKMYENMERG